MFNSQGAWHPFNLKVWSSDGEVSSQIFKDSFGDFNFAPDGKTLAIIRNKDKITSLADVGIYDPQKDKFQSLFDWDTNAARVVFSEDGKFLAACSRGLYAKLRIWVLSTINTARIVLECQINTMSRQFNLAPMGLV